MQEIAIPKQAFTIYDDYYGVPPRLSQGFRFYEGLPYRVDQNARYQEGYTAVHKMGATVYVKNDLITTAYLYEKEGPDHTEYQYYSAGVTMQRKRWHLITDTNKIRSVLDEIIFLNNHLFRFAKYKRWYVYLIYPLSGHQIEELI